MGLRASSPTTGCFLGNVPPVNLWALLGTDHLYSKRPIDCNSSSSLTEALVIKVEVQHQISQVRLGCATNAEPGL